MDLSFIVNARNPGAAGSIQPSPGNHTVHMCRGFVVMTGEVGTGKTTLLKAVLGSFVKVRVSSAFVFNPRLEVHDFLDFVLTEFETSR